MSEEKTSIILYVIENNVITDAYYYNSPNGIYHHMHILELIRNLCDPTRLYHNFPKPELYQYMLGNPIKSFNKFSLDKMLSFDCFSILQRFTHYKNPKDLTITADFKLCYCK